MRGDIDDAALLSPAWRRRARGSTLSRSGAVSSKDLVMADLMGTASLKAGYEHDVPAQIHLATRATSSGPDKAHDHFLLGQTGAEEDAGGRGTARGE
jgi:hypothetical protein